MVPLREGIVDFICLRESLYYIIRLESFVLMKLSLKGKLKYLSVVVREGRDIYINILKKGNTRSFTVHPPNMYLASSVTDTVLSLGIRRSVRHTDPLLHWLGLG